MAGHRQGIHHGHRYTAGCQAHPEDVPGRLREGRVWQGLDASGPAAHVRLAEHPDGPARHLGRTEETLAASEEAVTISRELAATRPDVYRPKLAMALTNLSNQLGDLGRTEEALAAIEEAVIIRRELAAQLPDAYACKLQQSLQVAARLEGRENLGDVSEWTAGNRSVWAAA